MRRLTWTAALLSIVAAVALAQPPASEQGVEEFPPTVRGLLASRPWATVSSSQGIVRITLFTDEQKQQVETAVAKYEEETAELRQQLEQEFAELREAETREWGGFSEYQRRRQEVSSRTPRLFGQTWSRVNFYPVTSIGEDYVMVRTRNGYTAYPLASIAAVTLAADDEHADAPQADPGERSPDTFRPSFRGDRRGE